MAKLTHEITEALGETGEGIEAADEIDMSKNNTFTNIWDMQTVVTRTSVDPH